MYSDLFDALGGAGGAGSASSRADNAGGGPSNEPKPLLSFKAGKVDLALQDDGKYTAIPDTRRGQVNLKYNDIPEEGKQQLRDAVGGKSITLQL